MTPSEFQQCAIKSAQSYFRYLDENGRGVISYAVRQIRRDGHFFHLHLRTKLSDALDPHELLFDFSGHRYTSFEIRPVSYSRETSVLTVRPLANLEQAFSSLQADDLLLLSDLKFLVKRVELWYRQYGHSIRLPVKSPIVTPFFSAHGNVLSEEQRAAVEGVLSRPFSYVWGAPGTGKTSCILSNCVLSYLLSSPDNRVLLLAPTNNALEQMLYGVLPALSQRHISLECVLRLGTPSAHFFAQYPEVCEFLQGERLLAAFIKKADFLKKGLAYLRFSAQFSNAVSAILEHIVNMQALFSLLQETNAAIKEAHRSSATIRANLVLTQDEINKLLLSISARKRTLSQSISFKIKRIFSPASAQQYVSLLQQEQMLLKELTEKAESLTAELALTQPLKVELTAKSENITTQIHGNIQTIVGMCGFWPTFQGAVQKMDFSLPDAGAEQFRSLQADYKSRMEQRGATYSSLAGRTQSEIQAELEACEREISALQEHSTESRLHSIRVLACTADRFLVSFSPDGYGAFCPNHIFIDEAGYTSLIKAVPALSLCAPVSFIGDHMQLPPVCEMSDQQLQEDGWGEVFLFAQSSLYAEDVLTNTLQQMLNTYILAHPPAFSAMKKYDLTATYRFGSALAKLLAPYVYSPSFHSVSASGTAIFCLDAPGTHEAKSRTNPNEVAAILAFLSRYELSNYAVLTPYRKQLSLLSSALPAAAKDGRILTVHASQGREWNILFFSVTDTHDKYFTDTQHNGARGKMIVNTAVSRARRALVLVCDKSYWSSQPTQLIGQLVLSSQTITDGLMEELNL